MLRGVSTQCVLACSFLIFVHVYWYAAMPIDQPVIGAFVPVKPRRCGWEDAVVVTSVVSLWLVESPGWRHVLHLDHLGAVERRFLLGGQ